MLFTAFLTLYLVIFTLSKFCFCQTSILEIKAKNGFKLRHIQDNRYYVNVLESTKGFQLACICNTNDCLHLKFEINGYHENILKEVK